MEQEQTAQQAILARLEKLEKQNRRYRFVGFSFLLVFVGLVLVGWKTVDQYSGQFFLKNTIGDTRGGFNYNTVNGSGTIWLGRVGKSSGNEFYRQSDIEIGYWGDDRPGISIRDKSQQIRVNVGIATDGTPNIWLYDQNGKVVWKAIK